MRFLEGNYSCPLIPEFLFAITSCLPCVQSGFRRKEFRGKLAIAITANFMNRNTTAEAKVEEISGVAFIFNQRFFQELRDTTGVDLENIVYYKDDTHYFVMTAKKQSLLEKGVILRVTAHTDGPPEWRDNLWHFITVLEASLQTRV